jgi:hypothetical protein
MLTHRQHVLQHLHLPSSTHLSLTGLAQKSGIPRSALQEVYNRGVGAWKNNPQSVRLKKDFSKNPNMGAFPRSARLSKEQWAMARVYSFVDHGKTYHTADADIARKIHG